VDQLWLMEIVTKEVPDVSTIKGRQPPARACTFQATNHPTVVLTDTLDWTEMDDHKPSRTRSRKSLAPPRRLAPFVRIAAGGSSRRATQIALTCESGEP